MEDQDPQNPRASEKKPEPKIRTMKSDIAEFMKETKPSLIQILTKQVEYQAGAPMEAQTRFPTKTILISVLALLAVGVVGWFAYQYFVSSATPLAVTQETVPDSPIFVEKTQSAISSPNPLQVQQIIQDAAQTAERSQSLKRLVISVKGNDGSTHFLAAKDFFNMFGASVPPQIIDSLSGPLFLYVYYGANGPRMIAAVPIRNADRVFAGMLSWEGSMQRDLNILFAGANINEIIAPFLDKTFKNIDYRLLAITPGTELGYFLFPAKNLLVISTADEALQFVINRLFEAH